MFTSIKKYNITDKLLLLTIITLPLHAHWNAKVIALILLFFLFGLYKDFKIRFPNISWFYIVFVVFASISYFWSQGKSETLITILRLYPFLLFPLAYKQFFSFKSPLKILRLSAVIFLFYALIWLSLALVRYTHTQDLNTFFYHELTAPFGASAVYIALIFGSLYIFLMYNLLFSNTKVKSFDLLLVSLLFGFQFFLSSKMILTALSLISIIFLFKHYQRSKAGWNLIFFILFFGLSISVIIGISSFTKKRFKDILDYKQIENAFTKDNFGQGYYWNGLTLRLFQLRCFYEIEKDDNFNSILGNGYNASQAVLNQKYAHYDLYRGPSGKGVSDGYFTYNFHNQYVQLIIDLGIFGVLLVILLVYFFIIQPIRDKNFLLLSISILFLSFALTESFLFRQKGIVSFALFPLLAYYIYHKKIICEQNH